MRIDDRIHDDDWNLDGTIIDVIEPEESAWDWITVQWDNGAISDFTPDDKTHLLEKGDYAKG
jgi:hypothetical protein